MPAAFTPSRSGDGCQSAETARALGFTRAGTPTVSTLHEVFKTLDVAAFEGALARWAHAALAPSSHAIALAGKMLRGIHGEELPGVRLVALYDVETGLALTQQGVRTAEETAEGKQEAELSVAPALLRAVALAGRVVTGDALYCQRTRLRQMLRAGGHFLFAVKANQPDLAAAVASLVVALRPAPTRCDVRGGAQTRPARQPP